MTVEFTHNWRCLEAELRGFVLKRLPTRVDAEDLLQEIAASAFSKRQQLADPDRFRAWVFSIARNHIMDFYRSNPQRWVRLEPQELENIAAPHREHDPAHDSTAAACIRSIIAWLPEKYREALLLADVEGHSFAQISVRSGISIPGAKSRAQRARAMLRSGLEECCTLEFDGYGHVADAELKPHNCRYCMVDHSHRCR